MPEKSIFKTLCIYSSWRIYHLDHLPPPRIRFWKWVTDIILLRHDSSVFHSYPTLNTLVNVGNRPGIIEYTFTAYTRFQADWMQLLVPLFLLSFRSYSYFLHCATWRWIKWLFILRSAIKSYNLVSNIFWYMDPVVSLPLHFYLIG